jgi:hypothetical protein
MKIRKCKDCIFWKRSPHENTRHYPYGVCFRYPQEVRKHETSWCGEYEIAKKKYKKIKKFWEREAKSKHRLYGFPINETEIELQ